MALKKSELYSSLWQSCDELRGGMDASQYKDYVLVLLFVKYVSDKYAGQPFAPITIPPGAGFADMVALKGKSDIGDQINKKVLGPLAAANKLSDMPDFADATKLGSGKSKGQFYTPAEVSRIMASILGVRHAKTTNNTTAYDPTCGSGSLLLKVGDATTTRITLYGQEKDAATAGLARMNMILHDNPTALIVQGNTLADPKFRTDDGQIKTFDFVVANFPFSDKRWSSGLTPDDDPYQRFTGYGIPPAKQGDYAYLLHIVRSLKSTGIGACILPHGVLFRGNAEGVIRKNLVQRGVVKGIIGLPANLFYGTGIPACIIVIDKLHAATRASGKGGIFMIDASKGLRKDGPKNRLREQDIHRIVDTFTRQVEVPGYARMVPLAEISDTKNDFNLNLPRYIDSTEPEDLQDIDAHLRGGIPERDLIDPNCAMAAYWQVFPAVRAALFQPADRPGYSQLRVSPADIKPAIFGHAEFTAFIATATKLFAQWRADYTPRLRGFAQGGHPKALTETIAEALLASFEHAPLLDAYDVYQHLMDYWGETMQDDCYLIAADGWVAAAQPRLIIEDKASGTKAPKTRPDFALGRKKYAAELIPPALVIARYFAKEQAAIDALEAQLAALAQQMEEMAEEHAGEGGLLEDAKNDKDKLTKASVAARLKEIGPKHRDSDPDTADERKVLQAYLALIEQDADIGAKLKAAQDALMVKVAAKYSQLTEDEIKTLVVDDKWLATLAAAVQGELDRVSQTLTGRIRQLAERYASPLPALTTEVETLAAKVAGHLQRMGVQP